VFQDRLFAGENSMEEFRIELLDRSRSLAVLDLLPEVLESAFDAGLKSFEYSLAGGSGDRSCNPGMVNFFGCMNRSLNFLWSDLFSGEEETRIVCNSHYGQ
jgi:hypothetical protein